MSSVSSEGWIMLEAEDEHPCTEAGPAQAEPPQAEPTQAELTQAEPTEAEPPQGECHAEPPQAEPQPSSELDLCFICDCTGSMGSYIEAAQKNILKIIKKIVKHHEAGVRFGLISYRDHPPQDKSYVTRRFDFTEVKATMREYVNSMKAGGGGDLPEAVTAALYDALHMPWRPNATKVCVLIADAPPHGLEPTGDGFPEGDPDGRDPLDIARDMAANGISVYTVGCEPTLSRKYHFARDFFCAIAEITSGQAVALSSAKLLADVIVNGSIEELSLAQLQKDIEEQARKVQLQAEKEGRKITLEETVTVTSKTLRSEGKETMQMRTDGVMTNNTKEHWGSLNGEKSGMKSLAKVKKDLTSSCSAPTTRDQQTDTSMPRAALTASSAPVERAPVSEEQVERMLRKARYQNRL